MKFFRRYKTTQTADELTVRRYGRIGLDVEAIRFMPLNQVEVADWCNGKLTVIPKNGDDSRPDLIIIIKGSNTNWVAHLGDFIMKIDDSVFYPCNYETFISMYKVIPDGPQ